jgi:hypothetical protein
MLHLGDSKSMLVPEWHSLVSFHIFSRLMHLNLKKEQQRTTTIFSMNTVTEHLKENYLPTRLQNCMIHVTEEYTHSQFDM